MFLTRREVCALLPTLFPLATALSARADDNSLPSGPFHFDQLPLHIANNNAAGAGLTSNRPHACVLRGPRHRVVAECVRQARLEPPEPKKLRAGNLLFILRDPEGQIVEFTQYLPGSLHADDKGKHLGDHRLSNRLQAAVVPVTNVDLEHAFYSDKLAFKPIATDRGRLRLPGDSGDELGLVPQPAPAQLIFSVEPEPPIVESLKKRSLAPKAEASLSPIRTAR